MKFCSNCGSEISDDSMFCSNCGTKLGDAPVAGPEYSAPAAAAPEPVAENSTADFYQSGQVSDNTFAGYAADTAPVSPEPSADGAMNAKTRAFGIVGFICGIISIVYCWLGVFPGVGIGIGLIPIAHGVVGLIFCIRTMNRMYFKLAKVGKILSIIGLCLSGILWIVGIILLASINAYYY